MLKKVIWDGFERYLLLISPFIETKKIVIIQKKEIVGPAKNYPDDHFLTLYNTIYS